MNADECVRHIVIQEREGKQGRGESSQSAIDSIRVGHVIMACAGVAHAARNAACWPSQPLRAHPFY